jgi:aspartate/methionine/tyrosine aminotransferase
LYGRPAVETFAWIRGRRALYDLANSGVAKLEVPAAAEAPPLEDVVASLYDVSKNEVALTAGAQEGNFLAFAAVKPEVVVTVRPEYEPIYRLPEAFGVRHVEVGSVWEAELRPGVLLVFSNPNNPTGAFLMKKELWQLADDARKKGAHLLVDVIFSDFVTDDLKGWPLENVAYSHSTDKFYTTDLRVGWLFGDRRVVERARFLKDLVNPGPREPERRAGAYLLSRREDVKKRNLALIRPNAEALLSAFPQARYVPHMPIALVEAGCDDVELAERLLARGVKTVPGRFFKAPHAVRVGLGVEEPRRFAEALKIAREEWCRGGG